MAADSEDDVLPRRHPRARVLGLALLAGAAEHDTIVLGRPGEEGGEAEDPRARVPAWEDIVFGVRRHR